MQLFHYRAYHLDRDGHIHHSDIVAAESDEAALQLAAHTRNLHGIELWDQSRLVGHAPPFDPAAIAPVEPA